MNKASERQARYDEKATRRFGLKLNLGTDADIIQKLEQMESIQGYLKELVRRDIDMEQERYKRYAVIDMSIEELNAEWQKAIPDLDYNRIFDSMSKTAVVKWLKESNASDDDFSIEEYIGTEDGEFIEGSDYDTPSNFIKRH